MCLTRRWEVREFPSSNGRGSYFVRCALPYKNEKRTSPGKAPGKKPLNPTIKRSDQAPCDLEDSTGPICDGLCVVLEEHQASRRVLDALRVQVSEYLNSAKDESEWIKKAKYLLSFPRAKYLKIETPPVPEGGAFAPRNPLKGWMKARLNAFNVKNTHLWSSWNEAKRCANPVSDGFIQKVYEEHFEKLSSPDPLEGKEQVLDEIFKNPHFSQILEKLGNSLSSQFDKLRLFREEFPSQSACFEMMRSRGGQCEALKNKAEIPSWCGLAIPELVNIEFYPRVRHQKMYISRTYSYYTSPFLSSWQKLAQFTGEEDLACEIRAVLEPLKVRVISKGNALPYYNFKVLQRRMHSWMREQPCFRLIGRKLCPTDLMDIYDPSKGLWMSVDYSAATDSLSGLFGMRIMKELLRFLPDDFRHGAEKVLGNHALWYPSEDGKTRIFRGIQRNGQLMGSILSFPILCLANLGLYLSLSPDHTPDKVLINGDDMLYCGDRPMWDLHVQRGEEIGLKMSVGKAYYHDTYCNVNSVSYHYSLRGNSLPREIPFLNAGLILGKHKVQGERSREDHLEDWQTTLLAKAHSSKEDEDGYVVNFNEILRGCYSEAMKKRVLESMIRDNGDIIRSDCTAFYYLNGKRKFFRKNLFLPISCGGMGVVRPLGFRNKISKIQRCVASTLIREMSPCSFQRPQQGYDYKELSQHPAPWQVAPDFEIPKVYRLIDASEARGVSSIIELVPFDQSPTTFV
jgi:hypothetical protein